MSTRTKCTDCGANRGIAVYSNSTYCFACNRRCLNKSLIKRNIIKYTKEDPILESLPDKALIYLRNLYITDAHIQKYSLQWAVNYDRISIPVLNGYWLRDISNNKNNKWLFIGKETPKLFYIMDFMYNKSIVLVEDIFSAIRIGDYQNVICLGGLNINNEHLQQLVNAFAAPSIFTWFDGDKSGQHAADKYYHRYKLLYNIKNIFTKKDPKNHTPTEIEEILKC